MTIKHKHINTNGDTEYTVEHRPADEQIVRRCSAAGRTRTSTVIWS